jgi:hypothetical protein
MRFQANSRAHLPGGSVTALARKPMKMSHHVLPPGPRQPQPAGDANVSRTLDGSFRLSDAVCHVPGSAHGPQGVL